MAAYRTPAALLRAVGDRAKVEARVRGGNPGDLLIQFYLSRLLARVFQHEPSGWILKGGQALLVRWPKARHSRDIDLLATRGDLDDAVATLVAASRIDLGDFIRFDHHSTSTERQEHDTRKVRFEAFCGTKRATVVSVDVVANLEPLGQPNTQALDGPFDIDLDAQATTVRMWPLEDHVADKIAAMYELHAGRPSSRHKDLVDLVVIASSSTLDGRTTHTALRREVTRRTAAGVELSLPTVFTVPDRRSWTSGYRAEAANARQLDNRYRTLKDAEELADRFVTPLLADEPPGTWHHTEARWV